MPASAPPAAPPQTALPTTCNVLNWVVFGHGLHKGTEFYSPAIVDRVPQNFARLHGHTTPRAKLGGAPIPGQEPAPKIGHDPDQLVALRLKVSMGFLSMGKVTRCATVPGHPGFFQIDVRGVPTRAVGGEISAERINSGSVELLPRIQDPSDPAKTIEGPILTGIAFLGEEQPAVRNWPPELRERAKPKATFDDGSPVPANPEPPDEWLEAQSFAMKALAERLGGEFSADRRTLRVNGREFNAATACFSDLSTLAPKPGSTMTPELQAALEAAGYTPDLIAKIGEMKAAAPVTAAAPPPPATGATAPPAPPPAMMTAEQMSACVKKMGEETEELKKRFGAYEAAKEGEQKKADEVQMAAFAAYYEPKIAALVRKVAPVELEQVVRPRIAAVGAAKAFSAETDRYKAADAILATYEKSPDDPSLVSTLKATAAVPAVDAKGLPLIEPASPLLNRMLREGGYLDRAGLAKELRARVAS